MRLGVVGAGITGLAAVDAAVDGGLDVVAFEASDEPGGAIRSVRRDGHVLEAGPQRFRLTDGVRETVETAGLSDAVRTADPDLPLYVYAEGRLRRVPRSVTGFLRTDLLSWRGKLRLLGEPLTDPIGDDETAAGAFTRKFGREAYENLVGPLYGGTYASDPARMPAEHALSGLARLEDREGSLLRAAVSRVLLPGGEERPPFVLEGGNQRLADGLYEAHADAVHLGTPVRALDRTGEDLRLETDEGDERVDAVVVTAPAPAAARMLDPVVAEADALEELTYNSVAMAYLEAPVDRRGLGYQVTREEDLRTLGVTWNGAAFDRDRLYTAFLGGMHDPAILDRDDEEIGAVAAREFERVMDREASVVGVQRVPEAIPAYDDTWAGLERVSTPEDVHLATNYTARLGVPARIREARRVVGDLAAG